MNKWIVASYKVNELARLELNLQNQKFNYYLPKITLIKFNSNLKKDFMFPGYIFLKIDMNQYSSLKYTKGIKKILKFGNTIPTINQDDIDAIMQVENESKKTPISFKYSIGQEVIIKDGSFKGNLAKICKLPSNKRVDILIYILGSQRKVNVSLRDIQN